MRKNNKVKSVLSSLLMFTMLASMTTGCFLYRPPNIPDVQEVQPHETAFVVPYEGDSKGVKLDSADKLRNQMVSTRRIKVTKSWRQLGRSWQWGKGEYIPDFLVVKVDRTPVTEEWTPELNGTSKSGDGIWVESRDSIGFSIGYRITANIPEDQAHVYLYNYRNRSLSRVINEEVKSRVQELLSNLSAQYDLDDLREKKTEIFPAIKKDTVDYFLTKGIEISALGPFGGFTYENPNIQSSIDDVFTAQQEKNINAAKLEAQEDANNRLKSEATAAAEAARLKAQGEADAELMIQTAKAEGIAKVTAALEQAQNNPMVIQYENVKVQAKIAEQWDGKLPNWLMTGGSSGENGEITQFPSVLVNSTPTDK